MTEYNNYIDELTDTVSGDEIAERMTLAEARLRAINNLCGSSNHLIKTGAVLRVFQLSFTNGLDFPEDWHE